RRAFGGAGVFRVNVPPAGAAITLAFSLSGAAGARDNPRNFALPGPLTAPAGVTLLVFALVQGPDAGWAAPSILAASSLGLAMLWAFSAIERRSPDPLLPRELLRSRPLASAVAIAVMFMAPVGSRLDFLSLLFPEVPCQHVI